MINFRHAFPCTSSLHRHIQRQTEQSQNQEAIWDYLNQIKIILEPRVQFGPGHSKTHTNFVFVWSNFSKIVVALSLMLLKFFNNARTIIFQSVGIHTWIIAQLINRLIYSRIYQLNKVEDYLP